MSNDPDRDIDATTTAGRQIGQTLLEVAGWLGGDRGDLSASFERGLRRFEAAGVQLARAGWAVPMMLDAREVGALQKRSTAAIDEAFSEMYEADGRRLFNIVARDLLARDVVSDWRPLIHQAVRAYRRADYAITIPALLIVVEGSLMRGTGAPKMMTYVKKQIRALERTSRSSVTLTLWRIIETYLETLFAGVAFDKPRPVVLNRHWILHGRSAADWTRADSLRMFQAVDTVSSMLTRGNNPFRLAGDSTF